MNSIRNDLASVPGLILFRANVGSGWTGSAVKKTGNLAVIENARPFDTGLPRGFPDLFGSYRGRFVGFEVKTPTGNVRAEQLACISALANNGAIAGIIRCTQDALDLLNETTTP